MHAFLSLRRSPRKAVQHGYNLHVKPRTNAARAEMMKNSRTTTFVLVLFFAVRSVCALDPNRDISQYAHSAWRLQDGFFSTPNSITQTADGYIWLGTLNGLVRFDGVKFVPWIAPKGQSLPDTRITSILGTRDGSLWIGTVAGLSRLKDGELLNYSHMPIGISSIIEDHTGTVWVTRYSVRDGKGPLCRAAGKELQCFGESDGIPVNYGIGLNEDSLGNLWIGSYMLCRWRPGSSATTYFKEELKHLKGDPGVLDIAAGPSGSLWAALEGAGPKLGVRHYVDGKWASYVVPGFDGSLVNGHTLFLDRDKVLWVGTETQGLYRVHGDMADHYRSVDGLTGDSVAGIYQDREGNLWVATNGGVDFFRDTPVVSFSTHEGLSSAGTRSVLASSDGSVWVGNQEALDVLREGKISTISARQGLPGQDGTALFEDHNHRLWIGTGEKLVIYEHGRFQEVRNSDGSAFRVEGGLFAITEDVDHDIWAMAGGHHLFRIRDQKVREEIPLNGIQFCNWLAADKKAGIWIGSVGNKLAHYHDGHLDIVQLTYRGAIVLRTRSLFVDSDNSIWAATTVGLFRWKDGHINVLDTRNGLPCSSIFSLVNDDQGSYWLYAQCGLLKITALELAKWKSQPDSKVAVESFDALDAVQAGSANAQPKASKSLDGRLWFVNGIALQMIDPSHLHRNDIVPAVHIEGLVANHQDYQLQKHLRLPALIHNLEIDYTALSFSVPRRVRFRYRLEGYDAGWQDPGTRRQAFYNDLRPGKYRFRVIACNNDGVWNETGEALDFNIAPAWYQTGWFMVLSVAFGILIVWILYRLRLQQVAAGINARFDERLDERTRMAREFHDTLLQTIQGSKMVADDALDEPNPVRMRHALERLSTWMGQATQEGRAALNSLRASTTQRNDLAEALLRAVDDCLARGSMGGSFSIEGTVAEMHPIVRDEIYRIGYEAIRNACLHSRATRLAVQLRYAQDLVLSVHDNGKGIDSGILASGKEGHFGLQGMRERATRIGAKLNLSSSSDSGTAIVLTVPGNVIFQRENLVRTFLIKIKGLFRR